MTAGDQAVAIGVPATELAAIGDHLDLDVALGRLGGSPTILVRTGISSAVDVDRLPERRLPDAVVDGVTDLLDRL